MDRRQFLSLVPKAGATAFFSASVGTLLEACGGTTTSSSQPEDTLARGRRQGYLRIGFNQNKPLSYTDPATGKLTGSGPTVIEQALKNVGIPNIQYSVVEFAGIIPGLLAKRWDISGIAPYITTPRCNQVAFTNPVNMYKEGALVRAGNPYNIHSYDDMKNPKIKVSIQEGDAEVPWVKQYGITNIVLFPQEPLAVQALKQGQVDVYLNSQFSLTADMKNYGGQGIELAKPFAGPAIDGKEIIAYAGFCLRHEDVTLLNALDEQIAAINKSGQLTTLQEPFGFSADETPPVSVTGKDVCPDAPWGAGYKQVKG
jgi:polar amino acid transport system substrate-binding protein